MRFAIPLAGVVVLAVPGVALGADCAAPYTTDQLLEDLAFVETAAQTDDPGGALIGADKMEKGLGCLDEKLVPMLIGRTYRSIGAGFMVGGDENSGRRWFRTAIEVDSGFEFGLEEYSADSPVRAAYMEVRNAPSTNPVPIEGMVMAEGDFYLDGRTLREAAATRGRPHLLQRVGESVESWLIDGNTFPSTVLVPDTGDAVADAGEPKKEKTKKPPKPPKEKKPKKEKAPKEDAVADGPPPPPPPGDNRIGRQRPPEKTPLIIAGGAVIAGAGVMYGLAITQRQKFDDIKDSEEDLRKAQQATNRLYLGSIAVLAAGAGTLTWGIILDGSGAPMPAIRGRF